jgi:hypothetical protein
MILFLVLFSAIACYVAQLTRPDPLGVGCLEPPQQINLVFSQKSPDDRLTTNIGFRTLNLNMARKRPPKKKRHYMYVYGENARNTVIYSNDLFDPISYSFGPSIVGNWIRTPYELIKKSREVKTISELIGKYSEHYYKTLTINQDKIEKFQSLVKSPELSDAWYNYEYFLLPHTQIEYELSRVMRAIIDQEMSEKAIETAVRRVKECTQKGQIFRFGSPSLTTKYAYSYSFKILMVTCEDIKNIQILAFHSRKTGFYSEPDSSRAEKRLVKKIVNIWLQNFFINMFSAPPIIEDIQEEREGLIEPDVSMEK